ncbi:hypothetical protein AMJ82_08160 [candidate division TA06 bacterium SM23_40]|uniref:C_GCAxxG_C_C family protein n=1 Tax=candidate division TA06 bacterium SM23_40 TaxID=1703774 RepID=A0A0S8G662_UNCT6|nr:MAG: hypothetical protein AMJ82_08160 [candidate division TA06 bacterium SM23_40]
MKRVEAAADCFEKGFNCAQAILSTYGTELGIEREHALRVAGPFGGGMGRMGNTCGAVTGAYMVIGLKHGAARAEDRESKERAYALTREFAEKFRARHGSIICRELLGCDIGTPEGYRQARDEKLFTTRCPKFVRDAAEIVEELIAR